MYFGICECKSIQYRFTGEPLTCYACYCTDCQITSESAFALTLIVNSKDINVIKGKILNASVDFNGIEAQKHYCGQCNTTLWFSTDIYPNMLALDPTTFEDTTWVNPIAHKWVRSAQSGVTFKKDSIKYQKNVTIPELIKLWANKKKCITNKDKSRSFAATLSCG